jgi:aspartate aminotransferase
MPRPPIAQKIVTDLAAASWVREMFERGRKLKAEYGEENVQDFSLGNPNAAPPAEFFTALHACVAEHTPAQHRYMSNAGFEGTRAAVAQFLVNEYGLPFDGGGIVMTCGAAGAMNVTLRAILDPGDEVIVLAPYFQEYRFYIDHAGGRMVVVESDRRFQPDPAALAAALTPRTRAVIVNTPNNPTGAVYSDAVLHELGSVLAGRDSDDAPIYLLCDDIYRRLVYDVPKCPVPARHYARSIVLSSYSKDLSIPGERIGYIAPHPQLPGRETVLAAMSMLNRTLGFVNAPALAQRIIARCTAALCDVGFYKENRDLLCSALRDFGYDLPTPGGAFYAFPRSPIPDELAFIDVLMRHRILAVPGRGFGRAGYLRLSYAVDRQTIERALPGFKAAIDEAR